MTMNNILEKLLQLPRIFKKIILATSDIVISLFSLEIAFLMRLEEWVRIDGKWFPLFVLTPLLTLLVFYMLGLYRTVIRHVSLDVVIRIIAAVGAVSVLIWTINYFFLKVPGLPRSLIAIFGLVLLSLVISSRIAMYLISFWELKERKSKIPVAIYGANKTGIQIATLWKGIDSDYRPLFFIDERPEKQSQEVGGLRVYPLQSVEKQLTRHSVKDIFVSLSLDTLSERVAILNKLSSYPVKVRILPSAPRHGFRAQDLKPIKIEDLMERNRVPPIQTLLERDIKEKNVLVTGAGGSIGSRLCEQIIRLQPDKLFVVEQSEYALFRLLNHLKNIKLSAETEIVSFLESASNPHFVDKLLMQNHMNVIYHVAAYKHVPLVEENMISGIANNVLSTQIIAESALRHGAGCLVLISTDKAVQPTSIMGASKRLAEMIVQSLAAYSNETRLCAVRFGNVMGSSGSVIPLFQEQINKRKAIYVTDPAAERYFMTIEEAAQLIIQAGAMGSKGEVFLLDMGEPINILEMAKKMIHLSGLEIKESGKGDIEIVYTGLRPGEKLREQLYSSSDIRPTEHPKIKQTTETIEDWGQLSLALSDLSMYVEQRDTNKIKELLEGIVTSYKLDIPGEDNG